MNKIIYRNQAWVKMTKNHEWVEMYKNYCKISWKRKSIKSFDMNQKWVKNEWKIKND